jgi:hypothetical protein
MKMMVIGGAIAEKSEFRLSIDHQLQPMLQGVHSVKVRDSLDEKRKTFQRTTAFRSTNMNKLAGTSEMGGGVKFH